MRDLVVGVALLLVGALVMLFFQPLIEVKSQNAVTQDQNSKLATQKPLRPQVIYDFDDTESAIYVFSRPLDAKTRSLVLQARLPDARSLLTKYDPVQIAAPPLNVRGPKSMGRSRLRISLEGNRVKPVLIQKITARIVKRLPPLSGGLVGTGPQGGDAVPKVQFNLDSSDLEARITKDDGTAGPHYINEHYSFLEFGEPMVMIVNAYTARCYCEWVIDMTVRSDGKVEKQTIDDNGRPFRTSAFARKYESEFWWAHMPNKGFEQKESHPSSQR
ncbi:hypothetical protein ACSDR0_26040 [Streptosporangium sp. G11]|uniref:hypothetical protein n=1 Tax=Streptosporangium sp. G11 TaxID=3436926 RepID=UPI003EB6F734